MNDFLPYKKGQHIYMIGYQTSFDSVIIDIRREEIISTFRAKQTRHFCLGEIETVDSYGNHHYVEIQHAFHNPVDALNSMTHVFSEHVMIYLLKEITEFQLSCKIGSYRFCVEIGIDGEKPIRSEAKYE